MHLLREDTLVVENCVAWAECVLVDELVVGDHTIVVARPEQMRVVRARASSLVFYQRAYHRTLQVEDLAAPGWA